MPMICPICHEQGLKSKLKFIGQEKEPGPLWNYDEEGHVIERAINVRVECDRGHQTNAQLTGVLDKAKQL